MTDLADASNVTLPPRTAAPASPDVVVAEAVTAAGSAAPEQGAAAAGRSSAAAGRSAASAAGSSAAEAVGGSAGADSSPEMLRLLAAFGTFQMHHARVLHHESVARGLNATDVRLVFFLASLEGGATPKQAGEYLELSTGAMTSLIDRLAARGHIERRPNPDDRRSIILHLTDSGEEVATQVGAIYHAAFSAVIPAEHRAALAEAFERIGDGLQRSLGTGA